MSKLKKKRIEIIRRIMSQHGIEYGYKSFISLWDLAYNINNTWNAKHFVNVGRFYSDNDHDFTLKAYLLHETFRAIRSAINGSDIHLLKSHSNGSEYLMIEDEVY